MMMESEELKLNIGKIGEVKVRKESESPENGD